jgi:hypothetical protein
MTSPLRKCLIRPGLTWFAQVGFVRLGYLTEAQRHRGHLGGSPIAFQFSASPRPQCLCERLLFRPGLTWFAQVGFVRLGYLTEAQRHRGRLGGSPIAFQFSASPRPQCLCERLLFRLGPTWFAQ